MKKGVKGWRGCLGVLFVGLLLFILGYYAYHEWVWEEWPPARIERISGVRIPKYKIVKKQKGERSFNGDHEDRLEIVFVTMPSDELFDEIDRLIAAGNSNWHRDGNRYSFSIMWGNGMPTPEGERDEDDTTFFISITRGEKNGEITSGSW